VTKIQLAEKTSWSGYLSTRMNLAQLSITVNPNNGAVMSAYMRKNCRANKVLHDVEEARIVYNPTCTVIAAVQDCYLASSIGERWYVNITCESCTDCPNRRCVFDLTSFAEYITELKPGQAVAAVPIYSGQRRYYSVHLPESARSQILALAVSQVAGEKDTYLSHVMASPHRCPSRAPYDIDLPKPHSNSTYPSDSNLITYRFAGSKHNPVKGTWYIRVDGCADSDSHTCGDLKYSLSTTVVPRVCDTPCMNGGTCTEAFTCSCPTSEWTGPTCETPVCRRNCNSHGRCIGPDICHCNSDWTGATCDTSKATGDGGDGDGGDGNGDGGDGNTGDGNSGDGTHPNGDGKSSSDDGLSGGQIAGIVIGVLLGVLALAAIAAGGVWYLRHRRLQREQQEIDYHVLNAQPLDDLTIDVDT